ncbi:glycosyltransferase [Shewanella sp. 5S214]|uniref:glycosyltransferase n=1 Tax=Shewanella sp. 5S214 TaxID=3229999 RepID=UPI00352D716C
MNIFITVGAQLPFSRLINIFDNDDFSKILNIKAQVGNDFNIYKNIETFRFLNESEYNDLIHWADIVVSHAGMGTIITCLEYDKPLLVLGRLADLNEHRNDHQTDTMSSFKDKFHNIKVFFNEESFVSFFSEVIKCSDFRILFSKGDAVSDFNSKSLDNNLSRFISDYIKNEK